MRVFGLFLLLPRLAPVGLIARQLVSDLVEVLVELTLHRHRVARFPFIAP